MDSRLLGRGDVPVEKPSRWPTPRIILRGYFAYKAPSLPKRTWISFLRRLSSAVEKNFMRGMMSPITADVMTRRAAPGAYPWSRRLGPCPRPTPTLAFDGGSYKTKCETECRLVDSSANHAQRQPHPLCALMRMPERWVRWVHAHKHVGLESGTTTDEFYLLRADMRTRAGFASKSLFWVEDGLGY